MVCINHFDIRGVKIQVSCRKSTNGFGMGRAHSCGLLVVSGCGGRRLVGFIEPVHVLVEGGKILFVREVGVHQWI
jgi:hypothetical protein